MLVQDDDNIVIIEPSWSLLHKQHVLVLIIILVIIEQHQTMRTWTTIALVVVVALLGQCKPKHLPSQQAGGHLRSFKAVGDKQRDDHLNNMIDKNSKVQSDHVLGTEKPPPINKNNTTISIFSVHGSRSFLPATTLRSELATSTTEHPLEVSTSNSIIISTSFSPKRRKSRNSNGQRFCGQKLVDVLDWICQGNIFARGGGKTKLPGNLSSNNSTKTGGGNPSGAKNFDVHSLQLGDIHKNSSDTIAATATLNEATLAARKRRGIVDECCKKACLVSEMVQYCNGRHLRE